MIYTVLEIQKGRSVQSIHLAQFLVFAIVCVTWAWRGKEARGWGCCGRHRRLLVGMTAGPFRAGIV